MDFCDVVDMINDSDDDSSVGGLNSDKEWELDQELEVSDHEIEYVNNDRMGAFYCNLMTICYTDF